MKTRKTFLILGIGTAFLSSFFVTESMAGSEHSHMKMDIQSMKMKAMKNVKKFMMLSPEERKKYMIKKQKEALSRGEKLFRSFGCNSCHPNGGTIGGAVQMGNMKVPIPSLKGVAKTFPKFKPGNDKVITLGEMNNNCLIMFLNRPPLDLNSQKAKDLIIYVSSF